MREFDIKHDIHVIFAIYIMFGGFIHGDSKVYTLVVATVMAMWVFFNGCVMNRGYGYPKSAITEQIFEDVGIKHGNIVFKILLLSGMIYSKNIILIIIYLLYELSTWLRSDLSHPSIEDAKSQ